MVGGGMRPEERAFSEFMQKVKPTPELSAPQRYGLAIALIVAAEVIEWVWCALFGPPTTFVWLLIAVLISSRCLGAGPAWFTAALAAMNLACDVPMNERYFGTVAAYLAVVLITQGSFGRSELRHRGKGPRVGKDIFLVRDRFAPRLSLGQNSIEQRRTAQQRACAISSFNTAR
jgi:hypothetical protein